MGISNYNSYWVVSGHIKTVRYNCTLFCTYTRTVLSIRLSPIESHRIQYEETFNASKNGDHEDVSPSPPPVPPHDYETIEFLLHAGESGFGFAIVGGANDGLPVSVCLIRRMIALGYQ